MRKYNDMELLSRLRSNLKNDGFKISETSHNGRRKLTAEKEMSNADNTSYYTSKVEYSFPETDSVHDNVSCSNCRCDESCNCNESKKVNYEYQSNKITADDVVAFLKDERVREELISIFIEAEKKLFGNILHLFN